MEFNYRSITSSGNTPVVIADSVADSTDSFSIERLLICNTDSTAITASVYLNDGVTDYYLLKNITIPVGATLDFLNGIPFTYQANNRVYVVLGDAGYTADIIFNHYTQL